MALLCEFACLANFNPKRPYRRETFANQRFSAGFGCVSSPWHNFTVKARPITEIDISRAQGGLDATIEMLETKRNRMRFLEKKIRDKVGRLFPPALGCALF